MSTELYRDGLARLDAGDAKEARRLLEAALQESPGDVEVMLGLSRALDMTGERERAVELLELAHAREPSAPEPACDLALSLLERGEDARAEQVVSPVVAAQPEHPRANLYLGMALAKTEPARARGHLERVLKGSDANAREQAVALDRVLAAHAPR